MKKLMILLLGGLIITLLSYFCFLDKAKRIQSQLITNVEGNYKENEMNWVKADAINSKFGPTRNIRLTGNAPSIELKQKAQKIALMQNGIYHVDNQITVETNIKVATSHKIKGSKDQNTTPIKTTNINDKHNASPVKIVKVDDNNSSVKIADIKSSDVYPYIINIQKDRDSKVIINGLIPDSKEHSEIISYAKELYGSSNVIDELREAKGAPKMWSTNIKKGLLELKETAYGSFDINQYRYNFTAYVDEQNTKDLLLQKYQADNHEGVLANFDINTIKKRSIIDIMLDSADEILAKAEKKVKNKFHDINSSKNKAKNINIKKNTNEIAYSCQDELKTTLSQNNIHFKYNQATIENDSYRLLDKLINIIKKCSNNKAIIIAGYTDSTGSKQYNLKLSQNRANAVKSYILNNSNLNYNLIAIGYGEAKPIADNSNPNGRSKNRRIEFNIIDSKDIANIDIPKIQMTPKKKKKITININDKASQYCQTQLNYLSSKEKIYFTPNRKKISKKSYKILNAISYVIQKCPHKKIIINTYTDSIGSKKENLILSKIKANAVKNYMIQRGVNENQIKAIGYGEANPIANNSTPSGRAKNRRVEFKLGGDK